MDYEDSYEAWRSWGEALRRRRTTLRLSQTRLSELTGIGYSSISQYECTGRSMTVFRAYELAKALRWTLEDWKKMSDEIERDGSWKRQKRRYKDGGQDT